MSKEHDEAASQLRALFEDAQSMESAALAYYREHRDAVRAATVAEYRCADRGCLLLVVWRTPVGLMSYQPPYRLSPDRNAAGSNAAGRRKNTSDGDRRWNARGGRLDDLRGWETAGLQLNCDHVQRFTPIGDVLADADGAAPGDPTRRNVTRAQ